jgi:hypothetical protein
LFDRLLRRFASARFFDDETPPRFGELTMKRLLIPTLLLTAGAAAAPAFASAASRSAAMDNCVGAFMESLARHNTALRLRETRLIGSADNPGVMTPVTSELVLTATDAHDYHTIGRAVCRLGARGQVVELQEVPPRGLLPAE